MKQNLISILLFILLGFISIGSKAQIKMNPDYFSFKYKKESSPYSFRLANRDSILAFSYRLYNSNPNIKVLPVDNMLCLIPPSDIKYHIQILNPYLTGDGYIYNMPNALPKGDLVKQ
jgi:hypothetical protein